MRNPEETHNPFAAGLVVSGSRFVALAGLVPLCFLFVSSLALLATMPMLATPAGASTWNVAGASTTCSNSGPGDTTTPLCTLQVAAQRAVAGDTVLVQPATYREQVTPSASGAPDAPITYRAAAPGAIVLGTLDVSSPGAWTPTSTSAWARPFSSTPKQVFLDGARLALASAPTQTTAGTFFYDDVARVLYVDAGGPNPGVGHVVEAGARTYGFNVSGLSNLVIEGFAVRGQNTAGIRVFGATGVIVNNVDSSLSGSYGIRVEGGPGPLTVANCTLSGSAAQGILLLNASGVILQGNTAHDNGNHGITLQGSSGNLIQGNTVYANARPLIRSAAGIDINGASSNNVIRANTAFGNQDSGIQVYNGSNGNLVVRNVSFGNGDHGFDTNHATGTSYVSNTSCRNTKDGFSVEGGSTDTRLADNIAVDNGLATGEFDLYVDPLSVTGLSSDYNIFWKSSAGTVVKHGGVLYPRIEDFRAATGQETHGLGSDPRFADLAAGDLHLAPGSPAIDSADAAPEGFVQPDRDQRLPTDNPVIGNTGAGVPRYADRGAYELAGPFAALTITPSSGVVNLAVTADASASTSSITEPIASYTFDFGDRTVAGPQSSATAAHTYTSAGTFTVALSITDTSGKISRATAQVRVRDNAPAARLAVTPTSGFTPLTISADASSSHDNDGTPIARYTFDFNDGRIVGPQVSPRAAHTYTQPGKYRITVNVTDTAGLTSRATVSVNVKRRP